MLGALLVLAEGAHAAASALDIHVVSNRPELVSGGDALVEIRVRRPEDRSALRVRLGDRDVTAAFLAPWRRPPARSGNRHAGRPQPADGDGG
jgi:hypothetical protein